MLLGLVLVLSVFALAVAVSLARWVLKQDNGTPEMRRVSDAIQEGAQAFLRRQYKTIGLLSIALEPESRAADRPARRRRVGAVRRRHEPARRRRPVCRHR